ncbi:MAG: hypothetical protein FK731_02785 [Asgard group archaeon]|nr:hypothetical protein [Asgard group archaeon]
MMKRERIPFVIIVILIISSFILIEGLVLRELASKSDLSFTDEDVIITINGSIAEFYARYALRNYGEVTNYMIILPFALKPWDVNVSINNELISYAWTRSMVDPEPEIFDAIRFDVNINYNEKLDVIVQYKRNYEIMPENESKGVFRYIVGSTKSWSKPLNFAHFELWKIETSKILLESRDYYNWMPTETFLYFYFDL